MKNENLTLLHRRLQQGRSLIELMVAIVLGSIVLAAVLYVSGNTAATGQRTDSLGRLTESGQVTLQILANEIRMAGYSTPFVTMDSIGYTKDHPFAGIRGCDTDFSNARGSGHALTLNELSCPSGANNTTNSASFSVVYQVDLTNANTVASAQPGLARTFADCRGYGLLMTSPLPEQGNTQSASPDRSDKWYWLMENRYYVDTSTSSLMCSGKGDPEFSNAQVLMTGVERMVVIYGVSNGVADPIKSPPDTVMVTEGVVAYMTAAQIDTTWSAEPPRMRWQRVSSARVCIEIVGDAGSATKISSGNFGSFINCNDQSKTITDGRQRRAVAMTISLRNRTAQPATNGLGLDGV